MGDDGKVKLKSIWEYYRELNSLTNGNKINLLYVFRYWRIKQNEKINKLLKKKSSFYVGPES